MAQHSSIDDRGFEGKGGSPRLLDLQLRELCSIATPHENAPQGIRRKSLCFDRGSYSRVRVRKTPGERFQCGEEVWDRIPRRNRQREHHMEALRKPVLAEADVNRF